MQDLTLARAIYTSATNLQGCALKCKSAGLPACFVDVPVTVVVVFLVLPSMCPLVASSAFALPFLICMLPLPFASLCSCPDASGLLFLSHVPCLLSLFCLLPFVEVGPALHSWSFCPSWFPSALSPRLYIASDIPPS